MTNESGEAGRREGSSEGEKREIGKRERESSLKGISEGETGLRDSGDSNKLFYGLNKVDDEDARCGNCFL